MKKQPLFDLDLSTGASLPRFAGGANPRKAFVEFATAEHNAGRWVILIGEGKAFDGLVKRVERATGTQVVPINGPGVYSICLRLE